MSVGLPACRQKFLQCLQQSPAAFGDSSTPLALTLPDGQTIYSRAAIESSEAQQLQALLLSAAAVDKSAAAQAAAALEAAAAKAADPAAGAGGVDAAAAAVAVPAEGSSSSSMTGAKLKAMQVICQM